MIKIKLSLLVAVIFVLVGCSDSAESPQPQYTDRNLADLCSNQFDVSETERPAQFEAYGHYAVMRGAIGSDTPDDVAELLDENPDLETLVIAYSPGSDDDAANLEAALMLHDAAIDTCVPPGGEISSGGVDLFLAGNARWLADDSWVGVHSWGGDDVNGSDILNDRNHPEHKLYLDYYRAIDIDEAFYWFTLAAAGADDMHNMTEAERDQYNIVTE